MPCSLLKNINSEEITFLVETGLSEPYYFNEMHPNILVGNIITYLMHVHVFQATHNVSNTCQHGPDYVLHRLRTVIVERKITFKQVG